MQFGHGRIIKNHTGAEAGTQFSQNRRFHFGINFRVHFGSPFGVVFSMLFEAWRPGRSWTAPLEASRAVREVSRAVPRGLKGRPRALKSGPGGLKSRLGDLDEPPGRPQDPPKRPLQPPGRAQKFPKRLRMVFASVPRAHRAMDQPFQHTRPDPSGLKGGFRIVGIREG